MAESVVFCVIQALGNLLLYEARYIQGVSSQLEGIQTKLKRLQAISKIADSRQHEDERIRDWVVETREAAYEAEDILDIFTVEISMRREGSLLRKYACMLKEFISLINHGPNIQNIESKISSLEADSRVFNIRPLGQGDSLDSTSERRRNIRRSYSHHEEDFVGLDADVDRLVCEVKNEDVDKSYHVVSMTGMGGIGKTALARKIYHHGDVRSHFHAFAWACISRQWKADEVLQRILNKLVPEKREHIERMKDIAELIKELFEVQKLKKCLVVLDDVWEMDVWDSLRPAFPNRNSGSKVLLTTRNKEIAQHIDTDTKCYLYEQRHLNERESWELLQKKAFPGISMRVEFEFGSESEYEDARSSTDSLKSGGTDDEAEEDNLSNSKRPQSEDGIRDISIQGDMEKLGKEMIGLCGGLPLAIIVLGGLLMTKTTVSEWKTVHQNFNSYLRRGRSLGENGRVYEVLSLSYDDLPYQVKPCFLHLGNFPEDYEIPVTKLFQMWAAEGFILSDCHPNEEDESIIDIAERYLRELVQRCMVQVQADESTGDTKSCQLHDLTRELCILKGKEENFLKRIPLWHDQKLIAASSTSPRTTSATVIRRLAVSVDNDFENYFPPESDLGHVRSALLFSRLTDRKYLQPILDLLCRDFKLLRVLCLERYDFGRKLSKAIGDLVHLRYLSFRGSIFYKLPSSIGHLKLLQTLDLRVPFHVCLTIPGGVVRKLTQLRHLYLPPSHKTKGKLQLSSLTNLEILKNFDSRFSDFRDILKLAKLQKLTAIFCLGMENLEAINEYLEKDSIRLRDSSFRIHFDFQSERDKCILRKLVGGVHLRKLDLVGYVNQLPEYSHFSQRLTKLILRKSGLRVDPMVTLEKLPNLYSLMIRRNAFEGKIIRCSVRGFRRLRNLEFQGLSRWEDWIIEEGSMPNLIHLSVDECSNFKKVPEGLKFVSTLREMVVNNMPETFKESVRRLEKGRENLYKVTIRETIWNQRREFEDQLGNSFAGLFRVVSPSLVPKEWQNP